MLSVVSFALSLMVVAPQLQSAGGIDGVLRTPSYQQIEGHFRPFLQKHSDKDVAERFWRLGEKLKGASQTGELVGDTPNEVLLMSFVLTELKEAFQVGVLLLIPFLVIDLVVTNILMLLGITQLNTEVASFPLKLLLFVFVDGWSLLSERLLGTYL